MDHRHAARVELEQVVDERNDGHDGGWGRGEGEASKTLDERGDKRGRKVPAVRVALRIAATSQKASYTHEDPMNTSRRRKKRGRYRTCMTSRSRSAYSFVKKSGYSLREMQVSVPPDHRKQASAQVVLGHEGEETVQREDSDRSACVAGSAQIGRAHV